MLRYVAIRLLLIGPTLLGIIGINFLIVQAAPGGPVEQISTQFSGLGGDASSDRISGEVAEIEPALAADSLYQGAQGLSPELIDELNHRYGFDRPAGERFVALVFDYAQLNLGSSFYQDRPVIELIKEKLPVSISLGLWTTLLVYLLSIPLGILKAVRNGDQFDTWSSLLIIVGYALPGFLFAIFLIVLFAGGSWLDWFPLRGLASDNADMLSPLARITDYLWHITLPVLALAVSGFASLSMLTKNAFLEEMGKQYVLTARAKGADEKRILLHHVLRNAMLVVVAGFPAAFTAILFSSSLLIEVIFSLDGLGLLGFEAALNRDYPVVFGTLFVFSLVGLIFNLIGDLLYVAVDPRISFSAQNR